MSALDDVLIAEAARLDALPADLRVIELVKLSASLPVLASVAARLEKGDAISSEEIDALAKGRGGKLVNDFISYLGTAGRRTMSAIKATPNKDKALIAATAAAGVGSGLAAGHLVNAINGNTDRQIAGRRDSYAAHLAQRRISDREVAARKKDGLDVPYKAKPGAIDPATGKPHGKLDESKYQSPAETGAANAGAWGTLVGAIGLASGRELGIKRAIARGGKAGVVGAILGGAGGALAEHYGPRTRRYTPAPTKKTGKDGRAGRDADGDGKKGEGKSGGKMAKGSGAFFQRIATASRRMKSSINSTPNPGPKTATTVGTIAAAAASAKAGRDGRAGRDGDGDGKKDEGKGGDVGQSSRSENPLGALRDEGFKVKNTMTGGENKGRLSESLSRHHNRSLTARMAAQAAGAKDLGVAADPGRRQKLGMVAQRKRDFSNGSTLWMPK